MQNIAITLMKPYLYTALLRQTLALVLSTSVAVSFFAQNLLADEPAPTLTQRLSLDKGWRFHLGDIPFPVITGHKDSYANAKAGKAWGAAAPDYDDTTWREVNLPHDWAIEGPFDEKANLSQGYRNRGFGWYRRTFMLDEADKGKALELQFDGVSTHCTVWVNGILAARNFCGYTSFQIDISQFARFGGQTNTIAVQVDANAMEGWWYEGAGIYRHTWLVKRNPVHIATDGVFAQPIKTAPSPNDSSSSAFVWQIPVEVTLNNSGRNPAPVQVSSTLFDAQGQVVTQAQGEATAAVYADTPVRYTLSVSSPELWSVDKPTLYQVVTSVQQDGKEIDRVVTHCGFRTERFDPNLGFFLNDQPMKLQGTCNHMDAAGVGTAVPDSIWDFRIRRLKEMGSNAYRCSHNPPPQEFLEACDRQGLLVMDENRNFNPTEEFLPQLRWMVRRDRNHPSVILWSVFNEEPMQGTPQGAEMVRKMAANVRQLDTSRPVTAAMSDGLVNEPNASDSVDVVGFNYQQGGYDKYHAAHPDRPITSSEDTSAYMTRGEWITNDAAHIKSSYDTERAYWGATHHQAWNEIAKRPFVAGDFVWTGFDYRGEPSPYTWPSASSYFGCMDLCGFPKMAYFYHQSQWIKDRPILTLQPHWNWAGQEGKPIKVIALTNADSVELSLNGQVISEQKVDPTAITSWEVPYAPGTLEAIAKKDGLEVARAQVETTGPVAGLKVTPDRPTAKGDGWDALPVTIEAIDAQGRTVPTANPMVKIAVSGPATVLGMDNGDPVCHEPEKTDTHSLFNGYAQATIQTLANGSGPVTLTATADGLTSGSATVQIDLAAEPAFVPTWNAHNAAFPLANWQMSPPSASPINPNETIADNDMNSWTAAPAGKLQSYAGYALFNIKFTPYTAIQQKGGTLTFAKLRGAAEVWLDGKKLDARPTSDEGDFSLAFPAGPGEHQLRVLIQAPADGQAGFGGGVEIRGS